MPEITEEQKPAVRAGEIGRTGTINTNGWIQGTETTAALRWPLSLTVFDNMRRTEIAVRAMLAYVFMPLRAADCVPEAASDSPEDEEIAATVAQIMREIDGGWDDVIRRMLSFLPMGFWLGEKVWDYREVEVDGKKRNVFAITRIPDRLQRTVQRWIEEDGKLVGVEQWLGDGRDPGTIVLPREKCILLVNEQEGSDYFGNSILRAAYGAFTNKRRLEHIEAIGIERSVGVPVVYSPTNAGDAQMDALEDELEKLTQAEAMYLVMPGPKQQSSGLVSDGWLVESLDIKGDGGTAKAHEAIERYKTELAQNVLAEFMRLGHNETGARATGETQSNPYIDALKAVASQLAQVLRTEFVEPIVRANFGENVAVPRVNFVGIEKVDVSQIADSFQKFATAGGITVTAKDEMHIRSLMGLPEIAEDEREEIQAEKVKQQQEAMKSKSVPKSGDDEDDPDEDPKSEKAHEHFSAPRTGQFVPRRELRGAEVHVAWDAIDRSIDSHRSEFAASGEAPMRAYVRELVATGSGSTEALEAALFRELVDTAVFGAAQVEKELQRQKHEPVAKFEARAPQLPKGVLEELRERASLAAQSIVATVGTAVARARVDQLRRRGTDDEAVIDAGQVAGGYALRDEAMQNVTSSLNLGRDAEAKDQGAVTATYSSVLDSGTCGPCNDADGTETATGSETYDNLFPPNPDCEGGNRCRCIMVYTGDESI